MIEVKGQAGGVFKVAVDGCMLRAYFGTEQEAQIAGEAYANPPDGYSSSSSGNVVQYNRGNRRYEHVQIYGRPDVGWMVERMTVSPNSRLRYNPVLDTETRRFDTLAEAVEWANQAFTA